MSIAQYTVDVPACDSSPRVTATRVTHEIDREGSKFIQAVSGGWPMILASLKTLLETGRPLEDPRMCT